jgi:amidohydrolase
MGEGKHPRRRICTDNKEDTIMTDENIEKMINLRHELHMHPELSMHEVWTKAHLMEFIRTNTHLCVTDCGHWFYAVYKSSNPAAKKLAFRADFDALPITETCDIPYVSCTSGVGHKCGHDGHSAALAGFALEIDRLGSDNTIYFIFQHAEETGQGGEECSALISDENIDMVFACHNRSGYPKDSIVYREGLTQCASEGLTVSFTGSPSHASQPEDGINPAPALAKLITYADSLVHNPIFSGMVLCTIVGCHIGNKDFGISAGYGELYMTLRADKEAEMLLLEKLIKEKAVQLAEESTKGNVGGLKMCVSFEISDPFPETRSHHSAVNMILKAADTLHLEVIEMPEAWRASEDFGYYTKKCPGAIFYIGNGEDYPMVHTGDYDFNDEVLKTIVAVYKTISDMKIVN